MDTILLVMMILLTPLTGIWAFILSESRVEDLSPENIQDFGIDDQMQKAVPDYALTPEQEAVLALNRIWDIWLRPEVQLLEKREVASPP